MHVLRVLSVHHGAPVYPSVRPRHALAFLLGLLVVAHLLVPEGLAGELTYLVGTVGAAVFACVAVSHEPVGERRTAGLLAAGVAASGAADVLFLLVSLAQGEEPDASTADAFWVASYVFLTGAVVARPLARRLRASIAAEEVIDLVSASVVVLLVTSQVVDFGALLHDGSVAPAVRVLWATYPVLDAILLAAVLRAVFAGRHRGAAGALMFGGVAFWLLSDFAYMMGSTADSSKWLDVGWMIGSWGLALATVPSSSPRRVAPDDPSLVSMPRIAMTLAPLIVPSLLAVVASDRGSVRHAVVLSAATAVLLACAMARAVRLVRVRDAQRARLTAQERYYRVLADNSSDAIVVIDAAGRLQRPAPHLVAMLGGSTPVADLVEMMPALERHRVRSFLDRLAADPGRRAEIEVSVPTGADEPRWLELRGVDLSDDPTIGGIVINVVDATRRKAAELELTHMAFHDTLTRLPNRALFQDRLEHALTRSAGSGRSIAVLFLDVDGFKCVNDRYGHATGDDVLTLIARRLTGVIRPDDTVARIGGDEFAILVDGAIDAAGVAEETAGRVLAALGEPVRSGSRELTLSASIGIAVSTDGSDATTLLRDADVAMYRSKADGKSRSTLYDDALSATTARERRLEIDIATAADRGQFHLVYQAVVELASDAVVGVEALARWQHPVHGAIAPDTFIPIAESTGAIDDLGRWILVEACRTFGSWPMSGAPGGSFLSVNLSAHQLARPDIVDTITRGVATSALDPTRLVLEVTETALIEDPESVARRLRALRDQGMRLAIDDFGTGYSSLSYLRQFPFDILKIDRSFVETITEEHPCPAILLGLLEFGRRLDMAVIAEGIETEVQLDTLREHGCEFGQGYLFSRPESPDLACARMLGAPAATPTPTGV